MEPPHDRAGGAPRSPARQLLITGGPILTQDPANPVAEALLVENGIVVLAGGTAEVGAAVRGDPEVLDLRGGSVCPGFIDVHNHFMFSVVAELGIDCRTPPLASIEQLLAEVERMARSTPPGRWIRGWGYNELELADGRHPRRDELDRVAPDHPVAIQHASGHACVANTAALAAAGITASTPDPPHGIIQRHRRSGEPTGLLQESASELVDVRARDAILASDPDRVRRAADTVARRYAALGLTRICDPCVPETAEPLYDELVTDPDFPIELIGLGMGRAGKFVPPLDRLERAERTEGFAISGMKYYADGGEQCAVCMPVGAAARSAVDTVVNAVRHRTLLAARLLTAPNARLTRGFQVRSGISFYRDAELADLLGRTVARGMSAAVHAMGNAGIDQVLDAVGEVRRTCADEARFRMEHVMLPSEDSLPRLADLGIAAVVQPRFVHDYGFPLLLTGMDRQFRILAFRDLIDSGALVAGSSDAPISPPDVLPAIEAAVTRRTEHGETLHQDQAITVEEALALYTVNAAAVLGLDRAGVLARGAAADFVVLDDDPRTVDPASIGSLTVLRTYRNGRLTHEPLSA